MNIRRFGRSYPLMAPGGEADGGGGEETVIDDDTTTGAGGEDTVGGGDRGDEVDPKLDAKALKKIAGEEPDPAGEGEAGGKKGSSHVPIGRFNEVNEEKKRLERENADLRAGKKPPEATPVPTPEPKPKFDEDKAELEYANHLALGEFDQAVALRKKINAHLREQAREEAEANVEARREVREVTQTLTQVAQQAVKDWPYLDTEDGAETMDLIIAARDGLHAKGIALPEALKKAVDKIAPKFAPEKTDTPGKELPQGKAGSDTRSRDAAARGAEASTKQPQRLDGGAGNRAAAGEVDVEDMTDEQFDALSPQEKARRRGDNS